MFLKSVRLNNIRSYTNENIEFPSGSTLLAGDIGAGKSTILLAIEFALFGIRRGQLGGNTLLRNGKNEGFVELIFNLDEKDHIIKRTLKRGKDDIKQQSGYLIIDGIKKEGTPVELKTWILDILGYPPDLVSKSRDLIYRYTVYTPQEEMRRILQEDQELRLDTLRRVFGIDKYKRIRENSLVYIRHLKEKRKEYEAKTEDLDDKKRLQESTEKEIANLQNRLNDLKPELEKIKLLLSEKKEKIKQYENSIKILNTYKKEFELLELDLKNKLQQYNDHIEKIQLLQKQIIELEKQTQLQNIKEEEVLLKSKEKEKNIELNEQETDLLRNRMREIEVRLKSSQDIKQKIAQLDKCPLCEQKVSHDHKGFISERENKVIQELERDLKIHLEKESNIKERLKKLKGEFEELQKIKNSLEIIKIKLENLQEKIKTRNGIEQQQEKIKKEIGDLNTRKIKAQEEISKLKDIDTLFDQEKKDYDSILEKERKLEISYEGLRKEKTIIEKALKNIDEEIKTKLTLKNKLNIVKQLQYWLEDHFLNLMSVMEKHVLLNVHHEFNHLFQNWFTALIEDENVSIRLDDEFTPIIIQNGYEVEFSNLSGGERTSCALAYRLSLNKVINDLISNIKTKDLIILDEPTDGFSTEQLDKVKEVLEELNLNQIIIVSHESKIESFVNKVIRIDKEEHISSINY